MTTTPHTQARQIAHALVIRETRITGQRNYTRQVTVITLNDGKRFADSETFNNQAADLAAQQGAFMSYVRSDYAEVKRHADNATAVTAVRATETKAGTLIAWLLEYDNGSPAHFVNDLEDAKAYVKNATGAARVSMHPANGEYSFSDGCGKLLATVRRVNALDYIEDSQGARKP